jgi:hypothetical protein
MWVLLGLYFEAVQHFGILCSHHFQGECDVKVGYGSVYRSQNRIRMRVGASCYSVAMGLVLKKKIWWKRDCNGIPHIWPSQNNCLLLSSVM